MFFLPYKFVTRHHTDWSSHRRSWLLALILMVLPTASVLAQFSFVAADDTEFNVEVLPADGELLLIFLQDHDEIRPQFEHMLKAIQAQGVEIWRVDLLADYFLPRGRSHVLQLPADGIAALIGEAHRRSDKRILLAAYERMPVPLLRGVRQWQKNAAPDHQLIGALLFYPNLFRFGTVAGQDPELLPIASATNLPLFIYQPEQGTQRWRLMEMLEALWQGGAPTHVGLVEGVRDWFFMHQPGKYPAEDSATNQVVEELLQVAELLAGHPRAGQPAPWPDQAAEHASEKPKREVHPFAVPVAAQTLNLRDRNGQIHDLQDYRGRVTLVSFWATWCPPCIKELPSLNRLRERFSDDQFAILSVDFRESVADVAAFLNRVPVQFPVLMDSDGHTSLDWKVFSFPSSFILDRQGRIRYSVNRSIDWEQPEMLERIRALLEK